MQFCACFNGSDVLGSSNQLIMQIRRWTNTEFTLDITSYITSTGRSGLVHTLMIMLGEGCRNTSEFDVQDNGGLINAMDKYDTVSRIKIQIIYDDSQNGDWKCDNSFIFYDAVYNSEC